MNQLSGNEKERIYQKLKKYCADNGIILDDDNFYSTCKKALKKEEYEHYFLPLDLWNKIDEYAKQGDKLFEDEKYAEAIIVYKNGIELIPEPKNNYEAKLWLTAAIADTYWEMRLYKKALMVLDESLLVVSGDKNTFIRLLRGQVFYELEDYDKARKEFKIGYELDRESFFEDVDEKYRQFMEEGTT